MTIIFKTLGQALGYVGNGIDMTPATMKPILLLIKNISKL